MKETAVVKSVDGDFCVCSVRRKSACGDNCATCKASCAGREHTFTAKNGIGAKPGDTVSVSLSTKDVLYSAFLVYILPLAAFLFGFGYFFETGKNELISAGWGLVFGGAVWGLVSLYSKYKKADLTPEVTQITKKALEN